MKYIHEKYAVFKSAWIRNRRLNPILIFLVASILVFVITLVFSSDFSPFFFHPISTYTSIQGDLGNKTPVSFFKIKPHQDQYTILDKEINSTGCGTILTLKPGSSTYMEMTSGNLHRRFIVYVPPHFENNTPHALILLFHGYASNPFTFETITHFKSVANMNNLVLIYPEGTKSLAQLRGWNTGLHPTIKVNDVLFVSNLLNLVQANICIKPNQIYATGFSNGGGFVAKLACQLSNRIAAFAPVSGSYVTSFKSCSATKPVSILEFHGSHDTIVPYNGFSEKKEQATFAWVSQWAKRDNCAPDPFITKESNNITEYKWIYCETNSSIEHYKILGEGHVWPDKHFLQSASNHTLYLNTAKVIWNFFNLHPLLSS